MKHLGDVTGIKGNEIPKVDVVTFGAPCQDLSIAGLRKGMKRVNNGDNENTRSGLFFEAIRIIVEMREDDKRNGRTGIFVRPRFAVYENVPGAFSSNRGRDFQRVLTECVRIAEPDAPDVPIPEKGWTRAGSIVGDGFSIAWRVLDAQFWGVPQRRRRICIIVDFGGKAAPEILFVRESLSGDTASGGTPGKETATGIGGGAYPAVARTLTAEHDGSFDPEGRGGNIVVQNAVHCLNPWDSQSGRVYDADGAFHSLVSCENAGMQRDAVFAVHQNQAGEVRIAETAYTLNTNANATGRNSLLCYDARGNGDGETVCALTGDHANRVTDYTPIVARCLTANQYKQKNREDAETYLSTGGIVRRLTPLEAERLQNFPDGWTDIGDYTDDKGRRRKTSDSARYRALGNSIALPPWKWVLKRIAAQYERDATMGSLFDGISGFPLIWTQLNGFGSVRWVSEIEPFCVAVCKKHFGDSATGERGDLHEILFQ